MCVRGVVSENTYLPAANSNISRSPGNAVTPLLKTDLDTEQAGSGGQHPAGTVLVVCFLSFPIPITSLLSLWSELAGADLARQLGKISQTLEARAQGRMLEHTCK